MQHFDTDIRDQKQTIDLFANQHKTFIQNPDHVSLVNHQALFHLPILLIYTHSSQLRLPSLHTPQPQHLPSSLNPLHLIPQQPRRPQITTPRMTLELLCPRSTSAQPAKLATGFVVAHFLVGLGAEEFSDPETAGVAGGGTGGEDVVGSDALHRSHGQYGVVE